VSPLHRDDAGRDNSAARVAPTNTTLSHDGAGRGHRLAFRGYAQPSVYPFDPCFGLSISRVDRIPQQLEAICQDIRNKKGFDTWQCRRAIR